MSGYSVASDKRHFLIIWVISGNLVSASSHQRPINWTSNGVQRARCCGLFSRSGCAVPQGRSEMISSDTGKPPPASPTADSLPIALAFICAEALDIMLCKSIRTEGRLGRPHSLEAAIAAGTSAGDMKRAGGSIRGALAIASMKVLALAISRLRECSK